MADDFLGKKMEEYRTRTTANSSHKLVTMSKLLAKNRSYRGYDPHFVVREDQLRRIVEVNTKIPSARNQQVLRFRLVLSDEAHKVLPHIHLGGALPELHLPLQGTEPHAFIIICSTVDEDRYVDMDLGISAQSMLLQAAEIGLNGICIGAFDRERIQQEFGLKLTPLLILALGKGNEKIELVTIGANDDHRYYRTAGIHYVPKVALSDLLLDAE
ncbi:MAG: nitroreductase family protein [Alistipes sp.]